MDLEDRIDKHASTLALRYEIYGIPNGCHNTNYANHNNR